MIGFVSRALFVPQLPLVLASIASVSASSAFSDSALFERWSHFKDYGVPAVLGKDAVNSAAIADGSCRMIMQVDGFFYWHYPSRVQRVLKALASAPHSDKPSYFTLSVRNLLRDACSDKNDRLAPPEYNYSAVAASVQNWYHALCAPSKDPSWQGMFDPAYQPQQMALTTGFICIASCASSNQELTPHAITALSSSSEAAQSARDAVCELFPWEKGSDFSSADTMESLSKMTKPLQNKPCACQGRPAVYM